MVKLEEAVIARFEHSGEKFEILVDPELALKLRKGVSVSMNELLAVNTVFKDAKKGTEVSPDALNNAFSTVDVEEIAKKIIEDGELQLTTEQRKKMLEQKRKEIIDFISRNAVNPQTNTPHPPVRIENAMNEAKINIDPFKSTKEQVDSIVKEIKKLIPISMERLQLAVKIPAEFSGKAVGVLHKYDLKKEDWQRDGSIIAVVDIPAGMKQDLLNDLNQVTHGEMETKIL